MCHLGRVRPFSPIFSFLSLRRFQTVATIILLIYDRFAKTVKGLRFELWQIENLALSNNTYMEGTLLYYLNLYNHEFGINSPLPHREVNINETKQIFCFCYQALQT